MAKRTPKKAAASASKTAHRDVMSVELLSTPSHEEIARRAFELFMGRGGHAGGELTDWLEAERQLTFVPGPITHAYAAE